MMFFYLIKIKIKHFNSSQSNIWYEFTARRTNRIVLWCSGYHVCLTRRRCPGQAWTASRQVFDKMMFFYLIKTKIKHFISNQSNIWYEITAQRTNLKVCGVVVIPLHYTQRVLSLSLDSIKLIFSQNDVFTWLKIKSSILYLVNSAFDMKLLLRSTNHKVLWWSGYHVWLTRRRTPVQT